MLLMFFAILNKQDNCFWDIYLSATYALFCDILRLCHGHEFMPDIYTTCYGVAVIGKNCII